MPTYQYRCTDCGHELEELQSFTDDSLTVCPVCGGPLRKVFNAVGVVFKGSGFYRNDSRQKSSSESSSSATTSDSSDSSSSTSTSESSSTPAKPSKDSPTSPSKSSPPTKPSKPGASSGTSGSSTRT